MSSWKGRSVILNNFSYGPARWNSSPVNAKSLLAPAEDQVRTIMSEVTPPVALFRLEDLQWKWLFLYILPLYPPRNSGQWRTFSSSGTPSRGFQSEKQEAQELGCSEPVRWRWTEFFLLLQTSAYLFSLPDLYNFINILSSAISSN